MEEALMERARDFERARGGGANLAGGAKCCGIVAGAIAFMCFLCVTSVSPLQYGLLKSSLSGAIGDVPVQGGLHLVAPWQSYVLFPATRITMQWSNSYSSDRPQVSTRTGADPNDPDSGGQPIGISCAVQVSLKKDMLKRMFINLGGYFAAQQRYILLAGNVVSNTAQKFTPQDFWQERHKIATAMRDRISEVLEPQGAIVDSFEIMKVDFAKAFEDSITSVQVAEQQKVVNEYNQKVQQVEQQINVLNSENEAAIATINARANRVSKEMMGNATKKAFIMKQEAKAKAYKKLQDALEFSPTQMAEYIKIRSLMSQSSAGGKVIVNVPPPSGSAHAAALDEL
eukprot:TRINITY_DN2954_c0_g1_i3.p1 TRINITY_DN2954_c0_g1~~TRINITY_DN2954_c0_g1_i3.p1  ORF type:complete len:342 (-),score=82.40 TRINITY_DN2954_c0_g1_i3:240-1265(-)